MHLTTTALQAPGALLRAALKLDAAVTGANGLAYAALAGPLSGPLGVGATPLRLAGLALVAFAAAVWLLGDRPRRTGVLAVVAINAVWAVESVVLVAAGIADPVLLGGVWIVAQAAVVAGFAALQVAGLRRA